MSCQFARHANRHNGRRGHRDFLLPFGYQRWSGQPRFLFSMSAAPEVRDAFSAEALSAAVRLISKCTDVPTDFPDVTLVWIAETSGTDGILTLERCGFSSFLLGRIAVCYRAGA